ncbi:MAG: hypothetical protein ACI3ZN_05885 [Candidatus Cryptobacteroides sp.]
MLKDYLRYMMAGNDQASDDSIKINGATWFGTLLIACIKTSPTPVHQDTSGKVAVRLELPSSDSTANLNNKWLYITSSDTKRLNSALMTIFEIDLFSYYEKAKHLGIQKKDAVSSFIVSRQLISKDVYEAIHKRIYRKEAARLDDMQHRLIRKLYYIDETISDKLPLENILKDEKNCI